MIFFFDRYTEYAEKLQDTMRRMGRTAEIMVMEENGFLPDGISSVYGYFLARQQGKKRTEKDLPAAFLNVPEPWEICITGSRGTICYDGCEKASVYFVSGAGRNGLQRIEWYREDGRVRRTDFYGQNGLKYASEFSGADGTAESKVFYAEDGKEILMEWPQNHTVVLLNHGATEALFTSWAGFAESCMAKAHPEEKKVLYVQDQECLERLDIKPEEEKIWDQLLFADSGLLEQYRNAGGKDGCRFYAVPESYPDNSARGEALILTASDRIEGIESLVSALECVTFHIAASTQVSDKLCRLGERKNVKVYPGAGAKLLETLWKQCDFYLDINHYREIYDAVDTAHRNNLLIMGFEHTIHNRELTADECVFAGQDSGKMVQTLQSLVDHPAEMKKRLVVQQHKKNSIWNRLLGPEKSMEE